MVLLRLDESALINPSTLTNISSNEETAGFECYYYSFTTLTTLGYGDIAPVSQVARASAVFFSLTAQIYLAVVIALIVGKYVSYSDKKELDN